MLPTVFYRSLLKESALDYYSVVAARFYIFSFFLQALHHYLIVPRENLATLKNSESRHLSLFRHMDERARNFIASQNLQISFRYGYHAIPITDQLVYLHAISQDFDSAWLRTKKQWNSFNTDYFIESTG